MLYSISNSVPKYFNIPKIKIFVPSWQIVNDYKMNIINESKYKELYTKQLEKIDFIAIYNHMINYKQIPIFLCYEGKNKFCHRHILSDYMNNTGMFIIQEL